MLNPLIWKGDIGIIMWVHAIAWTPQRKTRVLRGERIKNFSGKVVNCSNYRNGNRKVILLFLFVTALSRQPLRWLPADSHSFVQSPPLEWAGLTDPLWMNEILHKWWDVTSKIELQKSIFFPRYPLSFAHSLPGETGTMGLALLWWGTGEKPWDIVNEKLKPSILWFMRSRTSH